jgi:hypothetical protein
MIMRVSARGQAKGGADGKAKSFWRQAEGPRARPRTVRFAREGVTVSVARSRQNSPKGSHLHLSVLQGPDLDAGWGPIGTLNLNKSRREFAQTRHNSAAAEVCLGGS